MTTREILDIGAFANDSSADTLRAGGIKINNNFANIFWQLGGDSGALSNLIRFDSDKLIFEGNLIDSFETHIKPINPTADRTIKVPDASGTLILDSATATLLNKILNSPVLDKPQINDSDGNFQYIITPAGGLLADRVIFLPILGDSDTFVFEKNTQILLNKTLTTPTISSPSISTAINDGNGAELIAITSTASSVLNFSMINAATGGSPAFSAVGSDSDIDLLISAKNRGAVQFNKASYSMITISIAGIIPRNYSFVDFNSGSAIAMTLADGSINGEFKKLSSRGAGLLTITPTNFANGTSFAIAQNEACEVIWNGINWFLSGNQSVVTIT